MALEAKKRLNLTEVWLLINPQNPLKNSKEIAAFEHRAGLCELLTEGHPWLKVSYFEANTHSAYTAETLKRIKNRYPSTQFVWLMGSDNMPHFHRWRNWQTIIEQTPVVIFSRETKDNQRINMHELHSPAFTRYRKNRTSPRAKLHNTPQWRLLFVPCHQGRATDIREELHSEAIPSHLTPTQLSSPHLREGYGGDVYH